MGIVCPLLHNTARPGMTGKSCFGCCAEPNACPLDHLSDVPGPFSVASFPSSGQADYAARKAAVAAYNKANRWTKKGIALTPSKYAGKSYTKNLSVGRFS